MTPHDTSASSRRYRPARAFRVPDVAEAKAKLEAAGVQVNEMWDSGLCRGAASGPVRQSDPAAPSLRSVSRRLDALMHVEAVDFVGAAVDGHRAGDGVLRDTLGLPIATSTRRLGVLGSATVTLYAVRSPSRRGPGVRADAPSRSRCASPTSRRRARSSRRRASSSTGEILDTGVCHMAFFNDPDGNRLMLHRPVRAA